MECGFGMGLSRYPSKWWVIEERVSMEMGMDVDWSLDLGIGLDLGLGLGFELLIAQGRLVPLSDPTHIRR
jgi:hypothetical protein